MNTMSIKSFIIALLINMITFSLSVNIFASQGLRSTVFLYSRIEKPLFMNRETPSNTVDRHPWLAKIIYKYYLIKCLNDIICHLIYVIQGLPSGSFGPTTAGRMDSYVDEFQKAGGSMVMLAKGNRSKQVFLQFCTVDQYLHVYDWHLFLMFCFWII